MLTWRQLENDLLNKEQADAIKSCEENGHVWGRRENVRENVEEEYCQCCGWPRNMVARRAGGTRKDEEII